MEVSCANLYSAIHFFERLLPRERVGLNCARFCQADHRPGAFLLENVLLNVNIKPLPLFYEHCVGFEVADSHFGVGATENAQFFLLLMLSNYHRGVLSASWHLTALKI